ncbi:MAG: hypothetical protein JWP63_2466, partial [Candidatus Solibacter sp.]|nr:hypothetical protein [Candidatus Solibacter sp.]
LPRDPRLYTQDFILVVYRLTAFFPDVEHPRRTNPRPGIALPHSKVTAAPMDRP